MADIRPFQGVHYNPSRVKDLASVICPPYDVITPLMQQELYKRSDLNFVRIEYGHELPHDKETENKYTRALATLEQWLAQGTLQRDDAPAIYLHDHHFRHGGREYRRRSITGRVRLAEWSENIVRPHEATFTRARSDRLSMLWTLEANTSPILTLYEDNNKQIAPLLDKASRETPLLQTDYEGGDAHRLWAVQDEDIVSGIRRSLESQPLYIADGHHRYESALVYRRERRFGATPDTGEEPYDFVMMTLVAFDDPGLVILPAHRLVGGITRPVLGGIVKGLEAFFTISRLPGNNVGDVLEQLHRGDDDQVRLLIYGLAEDDFLLLELRADVTVSQMTPSFHADYNQKLDVSIVDHFILEELMGLTPESVGFSLAHTHDAAEAVEMVRSRDYQLAFLVSPVHPGLIKEIADRGERMPKKSTYFYPKMPAGLVFYRFGGK